MLLFMMALTSLGEEGEALVNRLFAENHKLMYNVALSILRSRELAEEALQESFVKIIRNLEKISSIPCPQQTPFCVVIVKNTALSILRKQKRVIYLEDLDYVPDEETVGTEEEYFAAAETRTLLEQLDTLPENDKVLLQLKWGNEMSYREIGALFGIGEEAAKKRGQRAVAKLRARYKGEVTVGG